MSAASFQPKFFQVSVHLVDLVAAFIWTEIIPPPFCIYCSNPTLSQSSVNTATRDRLFNLPLRNRDNRLLFLSSPFSIYLFKIIFLKGRCCEVHTDSSMRLLWHLSARAFPAAMETSHPTPPRSAVTSSPAKQQCIILQCTQIARLPSIPW